MAKKIESISKKPAPIKAGNNGMTNNGKILQPADKEKLLVLNETTVLYGHTTQPGKTSAASAKANYTRHIILTGASNKQESLMTSLEKMNVVRLGVTKKDLEKFKKVAALGYEELAKALAVTRATLINKKGEEKFNSTLSERIVGLADIYSYGYGVFEDEDHFNRWMFRPNQALAGKMPYDMVDNQFGREEVRNIIGRIDYGVYS